MLCAIFTTNAMSEALPAIFITSCQEAFYVRSNAKKLKGGVSCYLYHKKECLIVAVRAVALKCLPLIDAKLLANRTKRNAEFLSLFQVVGSNLYFLYFTTTNHFSLFSISSAI